MFHHYFKKTLTALSFLLVFAMGAFAQSTPQIGKSYYIAAQTWDGSKYIERFLYLNGNYVYQTTDLAVASPWSAITPKSGSGICLIYNSKSLMLAGITSTNWGSIIAEPTLTISEPPAGSMTIFSTVTNYKYFVIAPNNGDGLAGTKSYGTANESACQPKTSLFTPYFRFYETTTPLLSVAECNADGTSARIGAQYLLILNGKVPVAGNVWPLQAGTLTIDNGSYNHLFYKFLGFKVGNSATLVDEVSTDAMTANTTVKAVFAPNTLEGEVFTFINSSPAWYTSQQVYKAAYLDRADNMLKWKTYDPQDDAFYFKAHGTFDNLTFESVAQPGLYITGATTALGETGARVSLLPLGGGDYNIVANSQYLYANNHGNGANLSGPMSAAAGTSGSAAGWWIQSANDKAVETERYAAALDREAELIAETARQLARNALLAAIRNVTVGENMGDVTQDAYELALSTYENTSLSVDDYNNAQTLLYASCRVPAVGTKWRIINNGNSGQVLCVAIGNTLRHTTSKSSLHQIWEAVSIENEEDGTPTTRVAFRNLGSGTYMNCNTESSNSPTVTTETLSYVNLNAITPGIFSIEVLGRPNQYIYFATSPYGPGIIVNTSGAWRFVEVSETEVETLTAENETRRSRRNELAEMIADAKLLNSANGAIGYYSTLASAIAAAQTVYDDETRLTAEYEAGLTALRTAIGNAQTNQPAADALYIICDHNGRTAMQHEEGRATMTDFDDTAPDHFWRLAAVPSTDESILKKTLRFTLTSIDGENTLLNITATLTGNDEYLISIDGDVAWNAEYGQTPMSIHRGAVNVDNGYLEDGEIYRIRNVATGKLLTRSEVWTARVALANADNILDWNQFWRVEKQLGADRYQFHNLECDRVIEEQMTPGAYVMATHTPGIWHVQATANEGEYQLLTTMAPITQLAIGYNGENSVAAAQNAAGTVWKFEKLTPTEKINTRRQVYKIVNRNLSKNGKSDYLYTNNRWVGHSLSTNSVSSDAYERWIIIERDSIGADGTPVLDANGNKIRLAAIQSAYCAKYAVPVFSPSTKSLSATPFFYQMMDYTDASTGTKYILFKNPKANQYYATVSNKDNEQWVTSAGSALAHWSLKPVEGEFMNEEDIKNRSDAMWQYCPPADNAVVRIYTSNGTDMSVCLDEYYKTGVLQRKDYDTKRYAQLWRLHYDDATGLYQIENVYTGHYLMNTTSASAGFKTTDNVANAGYFAIAQNKNITSARYFNILDAKIGLGLSASGTNIVAAATSQTDAVTSTEFRFQPGSTLTDWTEEDYARMRRKYEDDKNMMNNVAKYEAILATIFTDRSCTTLRDDLTEETVNDAIDNLPEVLADMVAKIANDAWPLGASTGTNWDKMFRIREYPVVSNVNFGGLIGCMYNFSTMNEPTGVLAHPGDVVAIFVEEAPKAGSTLSLEMIEGMNRTGSKVSLKQGLNFVQVTEDCMLFIYYMVNSTANNPNFFLANFPDIKIHIEGGEVYGTINRVHGPGKTVAEANNLWVKMQRDGLLKNSPMLQIVGETVLLDFNSWDVLQGCPERMGDVIEIWDNWIRAQQWIMGLRDHDGKVIDDYIPNLSKRWNSRWVAIERTGGFMNAQVGGAQYNTSTIGGIVNFNSLKNGGGAWGPAHEHGHDHQPVINMCGMTEVSNNLFSNVSVREFGAVVSRGSSLPDVASVYARGGNWFDNNIWAMTQMYYKLYLYYHVAGHKPTFYPEVFAKLRANRMLHNNSVATPANRDYLQFALVCSEVAGEDLSEFFEAYGMLRPLTPEYSLRGESAFTNYKGYNCRIVGDYSNYYVYTTDQMLADARAAMQACGPKNGSILFIDDRIRREPATHPWATPGQTRAERGDGGRIGAYGNVGMWDDFKPENADKYATGFTLTKEWSAKGVVLHASGRNSVGYKIYGPDGELLYFSAFNDILIPTQILQKYDLSDLVVAIAQADGSSVEIACDGDHRFTATIYRNGSSEGVSLPVTGRLEPELKGNDICVVEPAEGYSADDYDFAENDNVVMKHSDTQHTVASLNISDGSGLYLPAGVTADRITYTRENTAGWNSVCLPVAVSEKDFGKGSKIYTVNGMLKQDDTYVIVFRRKLSIPAAEPCFVWCPDDVESWEITVEDATATTDVKVTASDDRAVSMKGAFSGTGIGEGHYILNTVGAPEVYDYEECARNYARSTSVSTGLYFERTADGVAAAPFRSFIATNATTQPSIELRVIDNTTGEEEVTLDVPMQQGCIYDLCGRLLPAAPKGKPYILNGRILLDN